MNKVFYFSFVLFVTVGAMEDAAKAGFDDQKFHLEIKLPEENRDIPSEHVIVEKSQEPFDLWNELEDKFDY